MTNQGGASYVAGMENGYGTVFSIPVTGGTPTTLLSFNGTNGGGPAGDLTLSADGSTLFGMTPNGGANGDGTIFSIPAAGGTLTTLLSFNGVDGRNPYGDLTLSGSTLYGMTEDGGANGYGNIFSVPVTGGTPTNLLSFNGTDGANSLWQFDAQWVNALWDDQRGGANGDGTIFSIPVTGGNAHDLTLVQRHERPISLWRFDAQRINALWDDLRRRDKWRRQHFQHSGDRRQPHESAVVQGTNGGRDPWGV